MTVNRQANATVTHERVHKSDAIFIAFDSGDGDDDDEVSRVPIMVIRSFAQQWLLAVETKQRARQRETPEGGRYRLERIAFSDS